MLKILVVADDFTGANDTGALLREKGFSTFSTFKEDISKDVRVKYDVICVNTDSRAISEEIAAQRVYKAVQMYREENTLISKRIDSTLRGNVGKEIDGALDAISDNCTAVVVAAAPRAGRVCIGGNVLVNGVLLEKCGVAKDPRTPVMHSGVVDIIKMQSKRNVNFISIQEIQRGDVNLSLKILELSGSIVVMDAVDMDDIRTIAMACIKAEIPIICVDPGDFTLEYAALKYKSAAEDAQKNLLVVGSLSKVSLEQLEFLKQQKDICLYNVDIERLIKSPKAEANFALAYIKEKGYNCGNLCINTAYSKRINSNLNLETEENIAEKIAGCLAAVALEILQTEKSKIKLVYLCGGDIAKAFANLADMEGLEPIAELSPLAVLGTAKGGELDGMKILTKGGMVGSKDTVHKMLSTIDIMNILDTDVSNTKKMSNSTKSKVSRRGI